MLLAPEWLTLALVSGVGLGLLTIALSQSPRRRRLAVPSLLATLAVVLGALGLAAPATQSVGTPRPLAIAIDVSPSMGADDVGATRLAAVQEALTGWLSTLPPAQRVSVVSFSGRITQLAPLVSPAQAKDAVGRLSLGRSTAVGAGIEAAADTLGGPGTVLVISDGTTNVGKPGNQAAREVMPEQVLVHGIVVGTDQGVVTIDGQAAPVPVEAGEIKAAVALSGGHYAQARSAAELRRALDAVDLRVQVTSWSWVCWMAAGAVIVVAAAVAGTGVVRWFGEHC